MDGTTNAGAAAALNEEQRLAVETTEGPVLIVAGAGTGKTKTLVARVARLVDMGVDPRKILAVTFTNKAADELKERVAREVGAERSAGVVAKTFHSFCADFLRAYAGRVGYDSPNFAIYDQADAKDLMGMIAAEKKRELEKEGYSTKSFPTAAALLETWSKVANSLVPIREAVAQAEGLEGFRAESEQILAKYVEEKKARQAMDYDDLLLYTWTILKWDENVREAAQKRFSYVMIDEYQDTNVVQDQIAGFLTQKSRNLCAVGDDNQSIYAFRGARLLNFLEFENRYPGTKRVTLFRNYRSTDEILNFANLVMSRATEGIRKDLRSTKHGPKPAIVASENREEIARRVADDVERRHAQGEPLSRMAAIARTGRATVALESELARRGIPFVKRGGQKFFSKEIVRNLMAYLRAALSDKDEIGWYLLLKQYPAIGEKRAKDFAQEVKENGRESIGTLRDIGYSYGPALAQVREVVEDISALDLKGALRYLLDDGYYERTREATIESSRMSYDAKAEALEKLRSDLTEAQALHELAAPYKSAREFLDDMTLSSSNPEPDEDAFVVTTIHSAKGLEWDVVHLLDPIQGHFPRSKAGEEGDAEELRCLYVAITRARDELFLHAPRTGVERGSLVEYALSHHLAHDDVLDAADLRGGAADMADGEGKWPDGGTFGRGGRGGAYGFGRLGGRWWNDGYGRYGGHDRRGGAGRPSGR